EANGWRPKRSEAIDASSLASLRPQQEFEANGWRSMHRAPLRFGLRSDPIFDPTEVPRSCPNSNVSPHFGRQTTMASDSLRRGIDCLMLTVRTCLVGFLLAAALTARADEQTFVEPAPPTSPAEARETVKSPQRFDIHIVSNGHCM